MTLLAAYAGRQADVLAFQNVSPPGRERLLGQALAADGTGGALAAGVELLAQRCLLVLLTPKGSKPYAPGEGTDFLVEAAAGAWRTVADVGQSFYAARLDMARQVQTAERDDDPDDERYALLELESVDLDFDTVRLRLSLTSRAGASVTFLAPLEVPLR